MVVCHCHRVTDAQVHAACAEDTSLRGVARATGAATGCGGCVRSLREILAAAATRTASVAPAWNDSSRAG